MSLLKIENLDKFYGSFKALDGLTLEVKENEVYGFIGRNGAGKTTTLNAIMKFFDFDAGTIYFAGKPLDKDDIDFKEHIAFVPDVPSFPEYLKGRDVLSLTADFVGLDKENKKKAIQDVIEKSEIIHPNKKVGQYSRGMRQRLAIACALLKKPRLLIMDEPTSALDPMGRKELLELIRKLKDETTILYSTHILGDAQSVCDRIGLIERGRMVLEGDIKYVLNRKSTNQFVLECDKLAETYRLFKERAKFIKHIELFDTHLCFTLKESATQRDIYALLSTYGVDVNKLAKMSQSLEDVFVEVLDENAA